jgi:hypothetical protein
VGLFFSFSMFDEALMRDPSDENSSILLDNLASFGRNRQLLRSRLAPSGGFVYAFSRPASVPFEVLREALRTLLGDASQWVCFCGFMLGTQ